MNVTTNLSTTVTYYWRVQAIDQLNAVTTPFSAASSFKIQSFDMTQVTMYSSPPDVGFWSQTASITSVNFTGEAFEVDFDRRDGPNRWPDLSIAPGSSDTLEYTLGMCLNLGGHWDCAADVQFWYGRDLDASGQPCTKWRRNGSTTPAGDR